MRFLLVLCCLLWVLAGTVSAEDGQGNFAGGTGTEEDPYLIETVVQLSQINDQPSAHYCLVKDIDLSEWDGGTIITQTFEGALDGAGCSLTGFTSDNGDTVFEEVDWDAVVENLCAENFTITGSGDIGGIIRENYGTIRNCSFSGSITTSSGRAGGIFATGSGKADRCSSAGTIVNTGGGRASTACAGGIVGGAYDANIIDCHNEADVSANFAAGGMIGYFQDGTIRGGSNSGTITVTYHSTAYIGAGGMAGVAGLNRVTVENCTNDGTIIADASVDRSNIGYAGGIVGEIGNKCTISGCINTGTVDSSNQSGGIAGGLDKDAIVRDCRNEGQIFTTYAPENSTPDAGGILGAGPAAIQRCSNLGGINSLYVYKTYYDMYEGGYTGGILGYGSGAVISDCLNAGDLSGRYCGGIYGGKYASANHCYSVTPAFNHAFTVPGAPKPRGNFYSGGIVGERASETTHPITNCFYLDTAYKGTAKGVDASVKCTAEVLLQKSVFTGFDFEQTWTMEGNVFYPYPELRGQNFSTEAVVFLQVEYNEEKISCTLQSLVPFDGWLFAAWYREDGKLLSVGDATVLAAQSDFMTDYAILMEQGEGDFCCVYLVMTDYAPILCPIVCEDEVI